MFPSPAAMSNSTSLSTEEAASVNSSGSRQQLSDHFACFNPPPPTLSVSTITLSSPHDQQPPPPKTKKKRSLPGNPDPDAEVIALSPKTLLATNRFVCEICNKGFQRDQNLQLHRRGHNLPWKLKQRSSKELIRKRAYVCPEPSCVHHHPSRALGDLTGIKKHFCRKHGEKKWKCDKCSKVYAVQSDWKAHTKTCGTREYRCDCGTLFSRKDSFITHRAFCDALAEESARLSAGQLALSSVAAAAAANPNHVTPHQISLFPFPNHPQYNPPTLPFTTLTCWDPPQNPSPNNTTTHAQRNQLLRQIKHEDQSHQYRFPPNPSLFQDAAPPQQHTHKGNLMTSNFQNHVAASSAATSAHLSATALLQKAASMGASSAGQQQVQSSGLAEFGTSSADYLGGFTSGDLATWQKTDRLTRDFLGLTSVDGSVGGNNGAATVVKDMLTYAAAGGVEFQPYQHDPRVRVHHALLKPQGFGFAETTSTTTASETWGDC